MPSNPYQGFASRCVSEKGLVVFPLSKPMERENARAEGMVAALGCWLEKRTRGQTDSLSYKARSCTSSGVQSKTRDRARQSSSKKRWRKETSSCFGEATESFGSNEIHQKPLSPKNSRKTCQQKIRQSDDPRFVLLVFRRHSPLVRSDPRGQESSRASRLAQGTVERSYH
jgi:hypothetical protein